MSASLFFDGASRGNPGLGGAGAILKTEAEADFVVCRFCGEDRTNNYCEYTGLIAGLEAALERGVGELEVYGDSRLVIEQMTGGWAVKSASLRPLYKRARELAERFTRIAFTHIRRGANSEADRAANRAIDER